VSGGLGYPVTLGLPVQVNDPGFRDLVQGDRVHGGVLSCAFVTWV